MVLSEAEAENRLAALRRERESLDRAIADLTLYLELGRRLTAAEPVPEPSGSVPFRRDPAEPPSGGAAAPMPTREAPWRPAASPAGSAPLPNEDTGPSLAERADAVAPPAPAAAGSETAAPARDAPDAKSALAIPESTLARRYGRALVREAVAVLAAAGRPLHASEILAELGARGFTVPGQQDPVAALNTRLWKRAAPGGPLRRLGDAIYALAEGGAGAHEDPGEA